MNTKTLGISLLVLLPLAACGDTVSGGVSQEDFDELLTQVAALEAQVTSHDAELVNARSTFTDVDARFDGIETDVGNAQGDATQALSDAAAAQTDATEALADAASAQSDATQALSDAVDAQADATQALADAADAASDAAAALTAANSAVSGVNALDTRVDAVEADIAALETKTQYLSVDNSTINGLAGPHVIFSGVNVHIRSGEGCTDGATNPPACDVGSGTPNALGNLIVGYNEAGGSDSTNRGGSHNLVVGRLHQYTSFGGLVAGYDNTLTGQESSISAGAFNQASGTRSSVSGGELNQSTSIYASVSGGNLNTAAGPRSSISGGQSNQTTGSASSVGGGTGNQASGTHSRVSGGNTNTASATASVVSGGQNLTNSTANTAVSGDAELIAARGLFVNLDARLDDFDTDIAALVTEDINLDGRIDSLETKTQYMSVDTNTLNGLAGPHVIFSGANVHVQSGEGCTNGATNPPACTTGAGTPNGLGNLVVGYNESNANGGLCTRPGQFNSTDCTAANGTWLTSYRTGSHNLAIGSEGGFTSYGGAVFSQANLSSAPFASLTGGRRGVASGNYSSVSGGESNWASGESSSVSGGASNRASSTQSSVSGGEQNLASGSRSHVSGGQSNTASGTFSTVSAGISNTASGNSSNVSGGQSQMAAAAFSSVSGDAELIAARGAFANLDARLDDVDGDISALVTEDTNLDNRIDALETKTQYMSVDANTLNGLAGPHVIFSGANVHIRSGEGCTDGATNPPTCDVGSGTPNALGNLIVGYNEASGSDSTNRGGSHSLVIGRFHQYTNFGGLIAGSNNAATGEEAAVSGGTGNTASGAASSVSGGNTRAASGADDWVAGSLFEDN